jgi:hypothetical protein
VEISVADGGSSPVIDVVGNRRDFGPCGYFIWLMM